MSKNNGKPITQTEEFQFPQKKEKTTFLQVFYNKNEGTFLGRTPKNWLQLLLFYVIFYIVLAALFTICMQGLFASLKDNEPTWQLDRSLIGTNPGLGYRPLSEETERGSVIQFDTKKPKEGQYWKELLDKYLEPYNRTGRKEKFCSFNQTHNPNDVCVVDLQSFGPCTAKDEYGFKQGRPCVFLKLNKIFGWTPEYYDNMKELPDDMPIKLKTHIESSTELNRQQVWVSCDGQTGKDKENVGTINYYPNQGFPGYYYPYQNQPGYLSPLIAVQFEKLSLNKMISIECRAWAKNIVYSRNDNRGRTGSVAFQLFID